MQLANGVVFSMDYLEDIKLHRYHNRKSDTSTKNKDSKSHLKRQCAQCLIRNNCTLKEIGSNALFFDLPFGKTYLKY